jgi:hypothetical protein
VDIPLKLPAPDFGTDVHAGPKSVVVDVEPDGMSEGIDEAPEEDGAEAAAFGAELDVAEVLPVLLHAAAPMARPATSTDPARVR